MLTCRCGWPPCGGRAADFRAPRDVPEDSIGPSVSSAVPTSAARQIPRTFPCRDMGYLSAGLSQLPSTSTVGLAKRAGRSEVMPIRARSAS